MSLVAMFVWATFLSIFLLSCMTFQYMQLITVLQLGSGREKDNTRRWCPWAWRWAACCWAPPPPGRVWNSSKQKTWVPMTRLTWCFMTLILASHSPRSAGLRGGWTTGWSRGLHRPCRAHPRYPVKMKFAAPTMGAHAMRISGHIASRIGIKR